ncbi:MAG: sulfate adenylyltransferase [Nanoarchaeota archaeon]|nr:sulfate adenylyltransferase [Nanoarchaeota archaeon]
MVKIIVTLGPSTKSEQDLRRIKDKGVDFVRINMSHSTLDDLKYFIALAKKVGIQFIIDTEGSQVRTGKLETDKIELEENDVITIYRDEKIGSVEGFSLKPKYAVEQLEVGDLLHIDFDTVTLCVSDVSTLADGYVKARAITGGFLGNNKAVVVDSGSGKQIHLPALSEKDQQSIQIGLQEGIGHIAASFIRSGEAVDEVRRATQNTMRIISKVECIEALENIQDIIRKSDYLLIDRGDLSKEIPVEKIPFTQKIILNRAKKYGTEVFVATNLLETMIKERKPTRAEVHDVINTIFDGAEGLCLSAETAIGKHPIACITMLNKLIRHAELAETKSVNEDAFVKKLEESNYLLNFDISSSLVEPHGGKLVDRMVNKIPEYIDQMPTIQLDENRQRDVEQIGIGTYSPLEGFMGSEDMQSVLDRMRLANGLAWPLPILLDVPENKAEELQVGHDVALIGNNGTMGILHLEEKYTFDKKEMAEKLYSIDNMEHPGVRMVMNMHPVLLAGKVSLLKRMKNPDKQYELTPKQTRKLFEERGWAKVVGFHTRNVPHRGHEFIQLSAMEKKNCDGLFVHPVVGKKKVGDYNAKYIIKAYELMSSFYPKNKVIFGTFSTYSRYAGPREALFTALCRKNFGCSHFVVGRDHTGVGKFYHPKASHTIFDRFPDLGIVPVRFDKVFYSKVLQEHVHETDVANHPQEDKFHVSGTEARKIFESGEVPPEWFMRPEIGKMILDSVQKGEDVFVKEAVKEV